MQLIFKKFLRNNSTGATKKVDIICKENIPFSDICMNGRCDLTLCEYEVFSGVDFWCLNEGIGGVFATNKLSTYVKYG